MSENGRITRYGENALRQAGRNVQKINAVLHMNRYPGNVTNAIVVVWGTRTQNGPIFSATRDAMLIDGDQLGEYLRALDTVLSPDDITSAYSAIAEFVERRLAHDKAKPVTSGVR